MEQWLEEGKGLRPAADSTGQMCPVQHMGQHSEGHEPEAHLARPLRVSQGVPKKDHDLSTVQIVWGEARAISVNPALSSWGVRAPQMSHLGQEPLVEGPQFQHAAPVPPHCQPCGHAGSHCLRRGDGLVAEQVFCVACEALKQKQ